MASRYFTANCQALRDEMTIVINERFLLELETAIRSFAQSESLLGSPYLKSLRRYFLLCICMDTAVKIAHVGCASGWIRSADVKRGSPQMLIMNFESIGRAVERLRGMR